MQRLFHYLTMLGLVSLLAAPLYGQGNTWRVPEDFATIQEAVNAATPGDQIRVGPGSWCGATVDKKLDLIGEGEATIIGCLSPTLGSSTPYNLLRIGFFLPDANASGTTIRHFVFDGQGASNTNLTPLSFAVFARDANSVIVEQNKILGTVQAITNTNGSAWTISHNDIEGFGVLDCTTGEKICGGGDAIVLQRRFTSGDYAVDSSVTFNTITGTIPDNFSDFSMTGIFVMGAEDGTVVKNNKISIPDNPTSNATGEGIVLTNNCCGVATDFLTTKNTLVANNDGRGSEYSLVIEKQTSGDTGNEAGAVIRGNLGVNDINGSGPTTVKNRSIHTLEEY